MKRYFIVLCLLLITPSILFAKFQVGDFYYEQISSDVREVRLVGLANEEVQNIDIPTKIRYNGITYKVTMFGDACFRSSNLVKITIPEGFQRVSNYMFNSSKRLKKVTLPSSMCIIDENAFSGCPELESVEFSKKPQYELSIERHAFEMCSKLKDFPFHELNLKTIDFGAFCGACLTHLEINGTPTIGEDAFTGCKNLRTITFYSAIGGIEQKTFRNCPKIDTIYSYAEKPKHLCEPNLEAPASLYFIVDDRVYKNATVVVPEDCIDAYKACYGWRVFWNYMDLLDTGVHSVKAQAQSLKVSSPSSCALRVSGLKPNETVRCYTTTGNLLCEYKAKSNEANLTLPVFSGNIVIVKAGTRSAKVRMR